VVPIFHQNKVIAILDVDSIHLDAFNEIDKRYLE
jgi:putative methionine-R-sulfoxide reductase with GAF domain